MLIKLPALLGTPLFSGILPLLPTNHAPFTKSKMSASAFCLRDCIVNLVAQEVLCDVMGLDG